jgi:sugar transferase (PEP-CTERM/EpsH1 system associated)
MTKILYITHRVPFPCDKGDRIRCAHILQLLSRYASVDLISLADEPIHPNAPQHLLRYARNLEFIHIGTLRKYLRMSIGLFSGRSLTESAFVTRLAKKAVRNALHRTNYDAVLLSSSALYPLVEKQLGAERLIIDIMDVDSRKWETYARQSFWLRPLYWRESHLVRLLENIIVNRANAIIVTTSRELQFLPKGQCVTVVSGNGVDCDYFTPSVRPSKNVRNFAFVGALDYWPNVDAVTWFVEHIWAQLVSAIPTASFHMIGRKPSARISRLARLPGIHVHSNVPDIRPILGQCGVAVFPLRCVFGIPNKVLEAMAMARVCIVTKEIAEVVGGVGGTHYLVADSEQEWLTWALKLHRCPNIADDIGLRARAFVATQYRWQERLQPLVKLLTSCDQAPPVFAHV